MSPRRLVLAFASLLLAASLRPAAAAPAEPHRVRVPLGSGVTVPMLQSAGLDLIEVHGSREVILLAWPDDEAALARIGARFEVLDEHPGTTAAARTHRELAGRPSPAGKAVRSAIRPDGRYRIEVLPPFGSGSMGGFWTSDEIKMKLDDLVASDVNDVVADKIDTVGSSRQGRPIWALTLGKRITGTDTRPVVFYNALTHAREPGGMQALFRFVDDLLAGYGTDPWKTYLLDTRRIVICPLVNPDGYKVNEDIYTGSGGTSFGLWRKNTRDNNGNLTFDSNDGVDLNRNFEYKWNFNNVGSSGSMSSDIYRGPSAASEPETQAQRNLVIALQPRTAISFHTYSDLFLHPWGYQATATPDSLAFYEWDDEATIGNGYDSGQSTRVLYEVNGEFNDWCYGETVAKPRVFSWTPEAGSPNDDFWPPPSRIVPLADENLRECYMVAGLAGPYVRLYASYFPDGQLTIGNLSHIRIDARNIGLASTSTGLNAKLVSLDTGAEVIGGPVSFPVLGSRVSSSPIGQASFLVGTADSLTPGRLIRFRVEFRDDAGLFCRDTVEVPAGVGTPRLIDNANSIANWFASGGWATRTDATWIGPFFADSPGNYPANANAVMTLKGSLDLSVGLHAWATFQTRWALETDYDCTVIEASLDSVTWTPLSGRATVPGINAGGPQPPGQPVYEGQRHLWKSERVDLSPFCGPTATRVRLRFRTLADTGTQFDGFNLDTLNISIFDPAAQPAAVAVGSARVPVFDLERPSPNPARARSVLAWTLPRAGEARLEILDVQGRRVATLAAGHFDASRYTRGWDLSDDGGNPVSPGVYLARLTTVDGVRFQRLVVLR